MNADTSNTSSVSLEDALTALFSNILGIDNLSSGFVKNPPKNVPNSITEDTYAVVYFNGVYTDCFCTESAEEVIDMIDAAKEHNIPIYDVGYYPAKSSSNPIMRLTNDTLDKLRANLVGQIQAESSNGGNGS